MVGLVIEHIFSESDLGPVAMFFTTALKNPSVL